MLDKLNANLCKKNANLEFENEQLQKELKKSNDFTTALKKQLEAKPIKDKKDKEMISQLKKLNNENVKKN